jgi:hypothetical protein
MGKEHGLGTGIGIGKEHGLGTGTGVGKEHGFGIGKEHGLGGIGSTPGQGSGLGFGMGDQGGIEGERQKPMDFGSREGLLSDRDKGFQGQNFGDQGTFGERGSDPKKIQEGFGTTGIGTTGTTGTTGIKPQDKGETFAEANRDNQSKIPDMNRI